MAKRGKNYRGSDRSKIGVAIPVLIILCIIAGTTLYFLSDDETYTKNGDSIIPAEAEKKEDVPSEEVDIVLERKGGETTAEEQKTGETSATQEKKETCGYFIELASVNDVAALDQELALAKVQTNVNTIVIEAKAESGELAFDYEHEFLKKKQLSGDDELLKSAIAKAKEQGFSVALYVSCFKDNGAAHSNFKNAVIQKGEGWVWRDSSDTRWLSPYSEASCGYITGIIEKLATFAPDEIILANVSFPAVGNTGSIDYGKNSAAKSDVIAGFINKATAAAGTVKLTSFYENYDAKRLPASGQDISVFKRGFKALYVARDGGKNTLSFDTAKTAVADDTYTLIPVAESFEDATESFMIRK
ncbi:MAG: hypothetical protein IJO09_04995 [Oscillospiraceae bacterium]|nr:hypothetical protein [Oscillospiraceae bacterium]